MSFGWNGRKPYPALVVVRMLRALTFTVPKTTVSLPMSVTPMLCRAPLTIPVVLVMWTSGVRRALVVTTWWQSVLMKVVVLGSELEAIPATWASACLWLLGPTCLGSQL